MSRQEEAGHPATPIIPTYAAVKSVFERFREMLVDLNNPVPDGRGGTRPIWPEEKESVLDEALLLEVAGELDEAYRALVEAEEGGGRLGANPNLWLRFGQVVRRAEAHIKEYPEERI